MEKIERHVYDSINSLAPYFGVRHLTNAWISPRFPEIKVVKECPVHGAHGVYDCTKNILFTEEEYGDDTRLITHEVGHWWHRMLNPSLFRQMTRLMNSQQKNKSGQNPLLPLKPDLFWVFDDLAESVAYYGVVLKDGRLNGTGVSGFTLQNLVKMDLASARSKKDELRELHNKLYSIYQSN